MDADAEDDPAAAAAVAADDTASAAGLPVRISLTKMPMRLPPATLMPTFSPGADLLSIVNQRDLPTAADVKPLDDTGDEDEDFDVTGNEVAPPPALADVTPEVP